MANPQKSGLSDNSISAMAYFTPIPAIFFLAIHRYNKRPYVRFHSWQSLLFFAFATIFSYLLAFILPFARYVGANTLSELRWVTLAVWIAIFLIWLWCVVGALSGKRSKLPVIGNWADEQAYR